MKKAILARKIGMTQVFTDSGALVGVTVLSAGPCVVLQKKTVDKEGYDAVKVGFCKAKQKHITKPVKGQFDKSGAEPLRFIKEFRFDDVSSYNVGDTIEVSVFAAGDKVDISGVSQGKGYQGTIKRYGHSRGPMSHGSKYHRGLGSLSSGTTPGRVKKGKKMPGHMGAASVTAQNLEIVKVVSEKNLIYIKGPVPGNNDGLLFLRDTVKR